MDPSIANNPELLRLLNEEKQRVMMNEMVAKLTSLCWDKCVTSAPGSKFSSSESSCLAHCAKRYADMSMVIIKSVQSKKIPFTGNRGKEASTVSGRETAFKGKNVEQLVDSGSHEIENNNVQKYRKVSTRRHEARASNKKNDKGKASWLRTDIRVRVISKHVKGGRLYLKKAVVTDVLGPTTCDITMDETQELVQGINQELIETALPRRGGPVLVLSGRHKGVYGSLVEKDFDKETGVVCDADSKEMLDVKLEQVAEYMGDPDDIGY